MKHTQTGLSAAQVEAMRNWLHGCLLASQTSSPDDHFYRGKYQQAHECIRMIDRMDPPWKAKALRARKRKAIAR